jgi:hypothetical protein
MGMARVFKIRSKNKICFQIIKNYCSAREMSCNLVAILKSRKFHTK